MLCGALAGERDKSLRSTIHARVPMDMVVVVEGFFSLAATGTGPEFGVECDATNHGKPPRR